MKFGRNVLCINMHWLTAITSFYVEKCCHLVSDTQHLPSTYAAAYASSWSIIRLYLLQRTLHVLWVHPPMAITSQVRREVAPHTIRRHCLRSIKTYSEISLNAAGGGMLIRYHHFRFHCRFSQLYSHPVWSVNGYWHDTTYEHVCTYVQFEGTSVTLL